MRNINIVGFALLASVLFGFSGCAESGRVDAVMLSKHNQVKGIKIYRAFTPVPDTQGYTGYQDDENAEYRCSVAYATHAIATKALQNGYPYFNIIYPKGSNSNPLPIITNEKMARYCAAPYWDKESNLLDDKCKHIGLGQGTPGAIGGIKGYFFKQRNPLVPLWDAKKTIRDTYPMLVKSCWKGDEVEFRKMIKKYNTYSIEEID